MRLLVPVVFALVLAVGPAATSQPVLCVKQKEGVLKGALKVRDGACRPKEVALQLSQLVSDEADERLTALEDEVDSQASALTALENDLAAQGAALAAHEESFADVSLAVEEMKNSTIFDLDGHLRLEPGPEPIAVFEGVNVQVTNGEGFTDTENGVGNLIVGYNEEPFLGPVERTGSHNVVVGSGSSYTSHAGVAIGRNHQISGRNGVAVGGTSNVVSGNDSVVVGGLAGEAPGNSAAIVGGIGANAEGRQSVVVGGTGGTTTNEAAVVVGGFGGEASGEGAVAVGGRVNTAAGDHATVTGGFNRTAEGTDDWVAGELFQDD